MKDYSKLLIGNIKVEHNKHIKAGLTVKELHILEYFMNQPLKFDFHEFKVNVNKGLYSDSDLLEGIKTLDEKKYLVYVEGIQDSFIELI